MQPMNQDGAALSERALDVSSPGGTAAGLYPWMLRWVATLPFTGVSRRGGRVRKAMTRGWYQFLTFMDRRVHMIFMNYGYAPLDPREPVPRLDAREAKDRYCIQLYHRVASAVDLRGKKVLEVGSGRGGGAAYVARYLEPGKMVGVDYAHGAVRFCRSRYDLPNLSFAPGDAERLPFGDESFDVVLNVESSHCYPDMARFAAEAARILKAGGRLLFADMRHRSALPDVRRAFDAAGLVVEEEQEITGNVLKALELDDDRKQSLIDREVPRVFRSLFRCFAGMKGTESHQSFASGAWVYWRFVLRKPEGEPEAGEAPQTGIGEWPQIHTDKPR